jgi:Aminoglycoside-2''-adenylyltransferase
MAARYTRRFYRDVLTSLERANVPVLVGGAFAFSHFTGIQRPTKDFDLFVRREHIERALATLADAGFHTELTFPHWLGKARSDEFLVDLIFGSGNGVAPVDDMWFENAVQAEAVGVPVWLSPAEELLWSKSFVMERERYDGADVIHILHARGPTLDWARLLDRFGDYWRVLLLNLVLYGFVYPGKESPAPRWVTDSLVSRFQDETEDPPKDERICRGTLISREQYLIDVLEWGYGDARMQPRGPMSATEIAHWTEAIGKG